eukprot:9211106-Pyramimonas_sp.AAC.1
MERAESAPPPSRMESEPDISRTLARWSFTMRRCVSGAAHARRREACACNSPTAPAPASAWPTADLAASMRSAPASAALSSPSADRSPGFPGSGLASAVMAAATSMGSPSAVPVPCSCSSDTNEGANPASRRHSRTTRCCAAPLGAVSALERPSWFAAVPLTSTHQILGKQGSDAR